MTEAKRPRKRFTVEFKKQLVHLYGSGKPRAEIIGLHLHLINGFVNSSIFYYEAKQRDYAGEEETANHIH
ncbi:hypothetical protein J32TS2_37060 [Shouchella clausii]|nr:hypothetical protein J32TS2_37060 [Shouchella clausii]SHM04001.1 hypothetical protein SAMN05192535_0077 [Shouchella rhizosphaerae]